MTGNEYIRNAAKLSIESMNGDFSETAKKAVKNILEFAQGVSAAISEAVNDKLNSHTVLIVSDILRRYADGIEGTAVEVSKSDFEVYKACIGHREVKMSVPSKLKLYEDD